MNKIRSRTAVLLLVVLLFAASPGTGQDWSAEEWSKAADSLGYTIWASALREEAYRSYRGDDPAIAATLAGQWLQQQLLIGLAAKAVATFRSLPPAVRTHIEEGPFETTSMGLIPDLRLELAAAHLLVGDSEGAAALAGKVPVSASSQDARLLQDLIALWLRPSPEDPFELLTEAAGQEHSGELVLQMLLSRVAKREGYAALSAYSSRSVASLLGYWTSGKSRVSRSLPARVTAARWRLETDLTSVRRGLERQARASAAKESRRSKSEAEIRARTTFRERIKPDRPGERSVFIRDESVIELFMIDRAGKKALGIWSVIRPPEGSHGGQIRLEESEGVWEADLVGYWIS